MKPSLFALVTLLSANILSAATSTTSKTPTTVADLGIDFVQVGDPGNPADTATGYGAVLDSFQLGKYDVTAKVWSIFLNSRAKNSDSYQLYDDRMNSDLNVASIARTGNATTGYSYAPISNATASLPIVYVNWFCAARFVNWMHNSAIAGHLLTTAENPLATEKGVYDLTTPVMIVTAKYVDFLNGTATTDDLHQKLYVNEASAANAISCTKKDDGTYQYALIQNNTSSDHTGVSWASAARFSNWKYNTETTQNPQHYTQAEITEKGLFDLTAGMKDITGDADVVPTDYAKMTPGAKYYLASEDQWHKAAYFKRESDQARAFITGSALKAEYWVYPTSSDTAPANQLAAQAPSAASSAWSGFTLSDDPLDRTPQAASTKYMDNGNGADYYIDSNSTNQKFTTGTKQPRLTPVGYFSKTVSPYGAFDMAGNASQWLSGTPAHNVTYPDGHIEWQYAGATRPIRGGGWGNVGQCPTGPEQFANSTSMVIDASVRRDYIGFRIAAPAANATSAPAN